MHGQKLKCHLFISDEVVCGIYIEPGHLLCMLFTYNPENCCVWYLYGTGKIVVYGIYIEPGRLLCMVFIKNRENSSHISLIILI